MRVSQGKETYQKEPTQFTIAIKIMIGDTTRRLTFKILATDLYLCSNVISPLF